MNSQAQSHIANSAAPNDVSLLLLKIEELKTTLEYISKANESGDANESCTCIEDCVAAANGALSKLNSSNLNSLVPQFISGNESQSLEPSHYLESGGDVCPVCGSHDLDAHRLEVDGSQAWGRVECGSCGASWSDVFKLVGYEDLQVSDEAQAKM
jgi:hypothetical protein